MSINSCTERLVNSLEVQKIRTSELSSEHTPSIDSLSTSPTNPDLLNPWTHSSTCSSLRQSPTVKFAPLPSPDSSRKRSPVPLGVAARSRRPRRVREVDGRSQSLWANDPAADPTLEDPLITLGKLVKSAGRGLWRRIRDRSGLSGQVQAVHHLTDTRPVDDLEDGVVVIPERKETIMDPEKRVYADAEQTPNNVDAKWRWRRSTGTMPSIPGLH